MRFLTSPLSLTLPLVFLAEVIFRLFKREKHIFALRQEATNRLERPFLIFGELFQQAALAQAGSCFGLRQTYSGRP
jgi:hypothetical protein